MSDKLNFCTKHGVSYVHECHSCYREQSECIHGVPFDSECGECKEDVQIVKAGKERSCSVKLNNSVNNGGLKFDQDKVMLSLVTPDFVYGVGEVLTFGAKKYAPNSWQTVSDAKRRYEDALYRHWLAYLSGEEIDKESGLSHLKHLATNAMFLMHFESVK